MKQECRTYIEVHEGNNPCLLSSKVYVPTQAIFPNKYNISSTEVTMSWPHLSASAQNKFDCKFRGVY